MSIIISGLYFEYGNGITGYYSSGPKDEAYYTKDKNGKIVNSYQKVYTSHEAFEYNMDHGTTIGNFIQDHPNGGAMSEEDEDKYLRTGAVYYDSNGTDHFVEADTPKPEYTGEADDDDRDSGNKENDDSVNDDESDDEERPVDPTDTVYRPAKSQPVTWEEICEAIQNKQGQYSNPIKDGSGRRRRIVLTAEMILEARKKGTDPVINWGKDGNVRVEYEITEDDVERAFLIHIGSRFRPAQTSGRRVSVSRYGAAAYTRPNRVRGDARTTTVQSTDIAQYQIQIETGMLLSLAQGLEAETVRLVREAKLKATIVTRPTSDVVRPSSSVVRPTSSVVRPASSVSGRGGSNGTDIGRQRTDRKS